GLQRVTYTNSRGDSIVFSSEPPFVLSKIEGLGDVDADVQTQKSPYQDGISYIDTILEPRFIEMEISVVGPNIEDKRRHLARVMNPKLYGTFKYENNTVVRQIEGINE